MLAENRRRVVECAAICRRGASRDCFIFGSIIVVRLEYPRILVSAGDAHAVPLVGAGRGHRLIFIIDQAHNASLLLLFYQGTRGHERGSNLSLGS